MTEFRNDEEEEMATKLSKPNPNSTVLGKTTKNDENDDEVVSKKQKLQEITSVDEKLDEEDDEEDDVEYDLNGNDGDDNEDEDDEDEDSNGKEVVDRKGKGKLIEESESSSDSDSGGDAEYDSDDSDLSDDPLAEVDLDNILPSRTRRNVPQRGIQIGNNDNKSDNHDA
ncbi:coiled-coil domain-containing protein 1 [Impatiens glandulifera]|uniref:coiled-coil domain-containing protein 1 n=1 Tax=Impatiens glandulifera TaxID=253017 RepID=UPI001FB08A67|nr:coiled-coil domain-containing protein 1 [Impatiens glandulifera]